MGSGGETEERSNGVEQRQRIIGKFSSRPFDRNGRAGSDIYLPLPLGFAEHRSGYSAIKAKVRARRSLASKREMRQGGGEGEKRGIREREERNALSAPIRCPRSRARAERAGPSS